MIVGDQTYYTLAECKRDFTMGYLGHWQIQRALLEPGWRVLFGPGRLTDRADSFFLVDARSKQPRLFKTLDAACAVIEEVGFEVSRLS